MPHARTDDRPSAPHAPGAGFRILALLGLRPRFRARRLVRRAMEHLIDGKIPAAEGLLDAARALDPDWAEPWYLLGRAAATDRRDAAAEAHWTAALARDPDHRRTHDALLELRARRHRPLMDAWHLYFSGRYAEAVTAFEEAGRGAHGDLAHLSRAEARAGVAWCRYALRAMEDARTAFEEALAQNPALVHARKGLGMALYWLGDFDQAERELEAALAQHPDLFDAQSFLGWCAYSRGDFDRALERFRRARELNELDPDAAWGFAWAAWRSGDRDLARSAFDDAMDLGPSHPTSSDAASVLANDPAGADLLPRLARRLLEEGLAAEALVVLERHGQLMPHDDADRLSATALVAAGRPAEALARLSTLPSQHLDAAFTERTPSADGSGFTEQQVSLRLLLARALLATGESEAALREVDRALANPATAPAARSLKGRILLLRGDIDAAEACLAAPPGGGRRPADPATRDALEDIRRRRTATVLEALARLEAGDPEGAIRRLGEPPAPPPAEVWRARLVAGRAILALGRPDEALARFREARDAAPAEPWPHLFILRTLCRLGRLDEAAGTARDAVARHPEDVDILAAAGDIADARGRPREARTYRRRARALLDR